MKFRSYGLAILCGLSATLTLPPIHLYPLLIPAFSGLFYLLWHASTKRAAFFTGWWFGLAYFSSGLYWFAYALLVEPDKFAWMIPFAVFGLPSLLAIYYGLCCLVFWGLAKQLQLKALSSVLLFALLWLGFELLRGTLFTGFPWNLIAYSWGFSDAMSQAVYPLGSYGYTGWTVLFATLPILYVIDKSKAAFALGLSLMMLIAPFGYGTWRLHANPTKYSDQTLHIVQGNIKQTMKWDPAQQYASLGKYKRLTAKADLPENTLIIWPETAFPYFLESEIPPLKWIAEALPKKGKLLTGAIRAQWNENRQGIKSISNSLHVVNPDAQVIAQYDKVRLVPFGEFVPFRDILPVEKITHGMQDFTAGNAAETIQLEGIASFQPLICYEAIFPDYISNTRPQWLLNVTNDAWFGVSSGPYQHLQMTRYRAIERGLPMVRAANTGVSAVFDALGRELARIPLNEEGSLTLKLPKPVGD